MKQKKSNSHLVFSCFVSLLVATALALIYHACVPLQPTASQGQQLVPKQLLFQDHTYEPNIQTVLLYPYLGAPNDALQPAALPIAQENRLRLEFDEINADYAGYYAQIIHCNADWTKSTLNNIEFLYDFNEFPILDYEVSFNTRTSYIHYTFEVPQVKLPGNYLLKVYRERDQNDLILTQRFMVYGQGAVIDPQIVNSSGVSQLRTHQQLEFNLNYGDYNIVNPMEEVKVVIRQNQRWDNAIANLKPTFVRENLRNLEYRHFNLENNFYGGIEFRFFDIRTVNFLGQNVADINLQPNSIEAALFPDRARGQDAYSQIEDLNGQFIIGNAETGNGAINSDYLTLNFTLVAPEAIQGDIYIAGELTGYDYTNDNKMVYNESAKAYQGSLYLKQGFYNYMYYVKNNTNPYLLEGSHFETENSYEIIAYYRPIGSRADLIIGYTSFIHNRRL